MESTKIVWKVPKNLYRELERAQQELAFPSVVDLVAQAVQRYLTELQRQAWQQEFRALQKQVRAAGGLQLGTTKEEVITKLREQRREIFEAEYAHLY
jgi:metal-responsive CopG/Arc/MetJ family transcriptional regulator